MSPAAAAAAASARPLASGVPQAAASGLDLPLHLQLAASQLFASLHHAGPQPPAVTAAAGQPVSPEAARAAPERLPTAPLSPPAAAAPPAGDAVATTAGGAVPAPTPATPRAAAAAPVPPGPLAPMISGVQPAAPRTSSVATPDGGHLATAAQRAMELALQGDVFARAAAANAAHLAASSGGGGGGGSFASYGGSSGMYPGAFPGASPLSYGPGGTGLPYGAPPPLELGGQAGAGGSMPMLVPIAASNGSASPMWALVSPYGLSHHGAAFGMYCALFGSGGGANGGGASAGGGVSSGGRGLGLVPEDGEVGGPGAGSSAGGESSAGTLLNLRNQFVKDSDIRYIEEIGNGAEGRVWRGKW
jgi:translation initiation factor IF-2